MFEVREEIPMLGLKTATLIWVSLSLSLSL